MARNRTPTALKIVKGTDQPCRTNKAEPKPEVGIPECPEHLPEAVKAAWPLIGGVLERMGVLTLSDALALEGLCSTYMELRTARASLQENGGGSLTYECVTEGGAKMYRPHPEVAMIADLDRRYQSWLGKFGLTPADRSKVSAIAKTEKDPWADL